MLCSQIIITGSHELLSLDVSGMTSAFITWILSRNWFASHFFRQTRSWCYPDASSDCLSPYLSLPLSFCPWTKDKLTELLNHWCTACLAFWFTDFCDYVKVLQTSLDRPLLRSSLYAVLHYYCCPLFWRASLGHTLIHVSLCGIGTSEGMFRSIVIVTTNANIPISGQICMKRNWQPYFEVSTSNGYAKSLK